MEILIDHEEVRMEFQRWCNHFGTNDPYATGNNVGLLDVLRAHFLIGDYFYGAGYGIALLGPKDPNLLHSAVYRQFVSYEGHDKWKTVFERCATLVFGLIKDHPFHDANKRTALLVLLYYLNKLGRAPTATQRELEDFVVQIADSELRKFRRFQEMESQDDPEIHFIADYIRRNSRHLDKRTYTITYRELDVCLRRYGFCLSNPHKGFIDICRIEESHGFLGLGRNRTKLIWLAQIGFQSWKSQVGKGAIATVRDKTRLVLEKGVDSTAFFRDADPLHSLIAEYTGPLQRLAYR